MLPYSLPKKENQVSQTDKFLDFPGKDIHPRLL